MSSLAGKAVGVLQICLYAVGVEGVAGFERVDHHQVCSCMWHAVAGAVAHFVFHRVLRYVFFLIGEGCFHLVVLRLVSEHQLGTQYTGCQIVACMLKVGANTQILTRLGLVEPVLALNVVFLLFLGIEGTSYQRQVGLRTEVARDAKSSEVGDEAVFLVSVKIHLETLHILHRSKGGLSVFGLKVVMVVGYVAYEVEFPSLVGSITQIGLVVEVFGLVLTLGFHRSEQV